MQRKRGTRRKTLWLTALAIVACALGGYAFIVWRSTSPLARAEASYAKGQYAAAIAQAQLSLREQPRRREALLVVARCLARLGQWRNAEEIFGRERDLSRFSRPDLEVRGQGLLALHWWPQAVQVYGELHRRWPKDAAIIQKLAVLQLQVGHADEAMHLTEKLVAFDDRVAAAYCIRGTVQESLRQHEQAVVSFERALEIDPTGTTLPVSHAQVIEKLVANLKAAGRVERALHYLETAVAEHPTPQLLCELADALLWQSDLDGARERYLQALKLDKDHQPAWVGLGSLALHEQQPAEAIGWLQQVLQSGRENTLIHYKLGQAYMLMGQLELAKYHQEESARIREREQDLAHEGRSALKNANSPQAKLTLARHALAAGDWSAAESFLIEVERQYPDDDQVKLLMAQVRLMQRQVLEGASPSEFER